ncbi:hypothetical protein MSG28_002921 [Choristoneura fumiferana]|uniref:Uncharacterized protein n=2 Tax=Choristoneura fumiferana TaxID=7141 RepID=A0ACC0JJV6_CHOFU|nr:hypothetical protein MSG28_002921 [Choristoneura fumiferana]KAI8424427.1 hypothetical protein MSG28_002921 [Choristoneura fumiferana]
MKMNIFIASIISVVLLTTVKAENLEDHDAYMSHFVADIWLEGADVVRILWRDCAKKLVDVKDVIDHKEYFPKFVRCMKRKTLRALDRSLSTDIVPIAEGVNLVRFEMVDKTGNIMPDNFTSMWSEKELEEGEWRTLAMQRMSKVLRTHVIKFDLEEGKTTAKVEFRGRRRHQMMVMMMFGIVSIGMVLIPMGFQFLAVLGGKALLLAKMALILASIQGLKKIGPSPLNYGFYHSYPPYDHYEKRSGDDWPPPVAMPGTPPPSLSKHNSWSNLESGNIKADRIDLGAVYTDDPNILVDVKDVIDHKEYFPKFVRCMKRKTLRALDRSLSTDIVPIAEGVNLVRFEMVDKTGIMPDNFTRYKLEKDTLSVFLTVLMMVMMMFGIVSIGMVLIPMGFQFLAVLGGKALLLAKMALILATIQGLKKIGPSPLNYGFYHSYPPYDHYEKRSGDDWPPPVAMPGTPPPSLSKHNSWSNFESGNIKTDRIDLGAGYTDDPNDVKHSDSSMTQFIKRKSDPRLYPVYNGSPDASPFTVIDSPTPLLDLTTTPGEVQADYTLELPYNGFRFQSPTPVVSS